MPHFRKIGVAEQAGYDADNSSQILPRGKSTTFYLVAGGGLNVEIDDPSVATVISGTGDDKSAHKSGALTGWENAQSVRKVVVKAGMSVGETYLRVRDNQNEQVKPMEIRVIDNPDYREVGKTLGECTPSLRESLQAMTLRDAVIAVAADQLRSAISNRSRGFGIYNIGDKADWCGAFAHWCWSQAAYVKGVANPGGNTGSVFWSPQRAIHWAMDPTSEGQVLRYTGPSPMTMKGKQEYRDIGYNGYELEPGDLVMVRAGHAGGWKHLALVEYVEGDIVHSIDGNQSMPLPSIKRRERKLSAKLPDGSTQLAFVHLLR